MSVPFRIGVMQLTMEPLDEMLASARVMDEVGMDTIWLAEAYPWWRKHGMEARSSTVVSGLMARTTQASAGDIADGCLTPSITTPAFVLYTRENVAADIDIGCTVVASIHASDRDTGRDGAREIAGMYLANKVQNIQGAADTLLDLAGLEQDEIRPVAEAMEQGGRLAAKAKVTDELLDKCKPIAGTPSDCIAAIEEYRDAGCTHVMLELWGANRHEQIRLFGEQVLPHFRR